MHQSILPLFSLIRNTSPLMLWKYLNVDFNCICPIEPEPLQLLFKLVKLPKEIWCSHQHRDACRNFRKHISLRALQQDSTIVAKLSILYICGVPCYASAAYDFRFYFNQSLLPENFYEFLIVSEQLLQKTTCNSLSNSFWLLWKISETYQCDNQRLLLYTTHCSAFGQ